MAPEPTVVAQDAPVKLLVRDLKNMTANKSQVHPWRLQLPASNPNHSTVILELAQIWLQGCIESCMNDSDNVLLSDGSGNVLVTKCSRAPGERSWIQPGAYCSVLACVKEPAKSPPEIEAVKLMYIAERRNEAKDMWPLEVQELSRFLSGQITFSLC